MLEQISSQPPVLLLVIVAALSFACSANTPRLDSSAVTASPSPARDSSPQESSKPVKPDASIKPTLGDVQEAVKRVCVDAVTIDMSQSEPFIVGDFNGDRSQDLAVLVRPAQGALPKLNSEYANWIIEDPRKVVPPDPNKT